MIDREPIIDREKVIAALKECANETGHCSKCQYRTVEYCEYAAMADAAVLLAEQESVKPIKKLGIVESFKCGACKWVLGWVTGFPLYCPRCGREVKWDG